MGAGAQDLLASVEERFLEFLDTVPDAMVLSDSTGAIVLVNTNAERLFGYSRSELLAQKVEILLPERFRNRHRSHRAIYYAHPGIRPMGAGVDLPALHKDGTEFPVEISLSPVEIAGNMFVWSAIRTINERDRSIAQLRAEFNKVHVLRGMVSICAWCKKIRDERGSWEQLERYIESHSETKVTHGMCEECLGKLDPTRTHG